MRKLFLILVFICALAAAPSLRAQAPVISPATAPVVLASATTTFSCASGGPCTWTCPGCKGSINPTTGVYTAPSSITAQHSYGGCQISPNDSIFNTNISSLPVNSNSATWIASLPNVAFSYLPDYYITYVNGSTPTQTLNPNYSPTTAGSYSIPPISTVKVEGGNWSYITNNINGAGIDNQVLTVNPSTCQIQEFYDLYPGGSITNASGNGTTVTFVTALNPLTMQTPLAVGMTVITGQFTGGCASLNNTSPGYTVATVTSTGFTALSSATPTGTCTGNYTSNYGQCTTTPNCNVQSAIAYQSSSYVIPPGGVGAGSVSGMLYTPFQLGIQEWENACATGGTINHAIKGTMDNNTFATNTYSWPATKGTSAGTGSIPMGSWYRLKASFNISTFSPCAQVFLKQLQQYGVINTDGGGVGMVVGSEAGYRQDEYAGGCFSGYSTGAFCEIRLANIGPSNFEFIDPSSLEVSATSSATTASETVVATGPGGSASQQVVLTGITVNQARDSQTFQAGAPATQLVAYINGDPASAGLTWSGGANYGATIQPAGVAWGTTYTTSATSVQTANPPTVNSSGAIKSVTNYLEVAAIFSLSVTNPTSVTDLCGNTLTHYSAADYTVPGGGIWSGAYSIWYFIGMTGCSSTVWTATWSSSSSYQSGAMQLFNVNGASMSVSSAPAPVVQSGSTSSITVGPFNVPANSVVIHMLAIPFSQAASGTIGSLTASNCVNPEYIAGPYQEAPAMCSAVFGQAQTGISSTFTWSAGSGSGISTIIFTGTGGTSIYGTLSSSGVFTPPSTATSTVTFTAYATSVSNSAVTAPMQVAVVPNGTIRIIEGQETSYVDSFGNTWQPRLASGGGGDNADYGRAIIGSVTGTPDPKLYANAVNGYGDTTYDFTVANGTYNVTEKYAMASGVSAGQVVFRLEAGGVVVNPSFDVAALVGDLVAIDQTYTVNVTNNDLILVVRWLSGAYGGTQLNSVQITPVATPTPAAPCKPAVCLMLAKNQ
jgi:Malectin domain